MPKVWNRLQKIGKKAAKFNLTLYSHELTITCINSKWYPNKVRIIWNRNSNKKSLEFVKWEPNLKNIFIGNCVWNAKDEANFDLTFYKSSTSIQDCNYDLKEILIEIENEDTSGKRKILAHGKINMAENMNQFDLIDREIKFELKVTSTKIKSALVVFKLKCELIKEGQATDADMISLASYASSTLTTFSNKTPTSQYDDSDYNQEEDEILNKWNRFGRVENVERQVNAPRVMFKKDSNNNTKELNETIQENESTQLDLSKIKQNEFISFDYFEFKTFENSRDNDFEMDHLNPFYNKNNNEEPIINKNPFEEEETKEMVEEMNESVIQLLEWCNRITNLEIKDFSKSWSNGKAFYLILKHYRPDQVKNFTCLNENEEENLRFVFEKFKQEKKLTRLIDVNDLLNKQEPDKLLIMTFVNELKTYFESPLSLFKQQQSSTPKKSFENKSQFLNPFDNDYDDNDEGDNEKEINFSFKEKAIQLINKSKTQSLNKSIQQQLDKNDFNCDELQVLFKEQKDLDESAVCLEKKLRSLMKSNDNVSQEETLMREWFLLVNKKNMLLHRQFELELLQNEKNLEKRYNFLTKELHTLSRIDDFDKTYEQRQLEKRLLNELVQLVNKRNELVEQLDEENRLLESEIEIDDYVRNKRDLSGSSRASNKTNCSIQ